MLNKLLYSVFKNPVLVRLVKGSVAVAVAAVVAFLVKELANPANEISITIGATLTPLLLALDKWVSKRGGE